MRKKTGMLRLRLRKVYPCSHILARKQGSLSYRFTVWEHSVISRVVRTFSKSIEAYGKLPLCHLRLDCRCATPFFLEPHHLSSHLQVPYLPCVLLPMSLEGVSPFPLHNFTWLKTQQPRLLKTGRVPFCCPAIPFWSKIQHTEQKYKLPSHL